MDKVVTSLTVLAVSVLVCMAIGSLQRAAMRSTTPNMGTNVEACAHPVYCNNTLLCSVQMSGIFSDSKTFVDKPMKQAANVVLQAFDALGSDPTVEQIAGWLAAYFDEEGTDLVDWTPGDAGQTPALLAEIADAQLRAFAQSLVSIWPTLGRKYTPEYLLKQQQSSLLAVPNGFVVPGGRFREFYYWDTYFILEGLLLSGMNHTARGMIENLLHLVQSGGFVPNGGRIYYMNRSQPPFLTLMVRLYWESTQDLSLVAAALPVLAQEYQFWQANRSVTLPGPNGTTLQLNTYGASTNLPRPEGWVEDITTAQGSRTLEAARQLWHNIASSAETGWDFSSRWCAFGSNLSSLETSHIVPVDLNAILYGVEDSLSLLYLQVGDQANSRAFRDSAEARRVAIEELLWNEEVGFWNDFHLVTRRHKSAHFYVSNVVPMWTGAYSPSPQRTQQILAYLQNPANGVLSYPGGVPTSLMFDTSQQWDFPNAWPPEQLFVIEGLRRLDYQPADGVAAKIALQLAQTWVSSNYLAWQATNGGMFEKYNVTHVGVPGGGGEYPTQTGFGWSNGVVLQLLSLYPTQLIAPSSGQSQHQNNHLVRPSSDHLLNSKSSVNPVFCSIPSSRK